MAPLVGQLVAIGMAYFHGGVSMVEFAAINGVFVFLIGIVPLVIVLGVMTMLLPRARSPVLVIGSCVLPFETYSAMISWLG